MGSFGPLRQRSYHSSHLIIPYISVRYVRCKATQFAWLRPIITKCSYNALGWLLGGLELSQNGSDLFSSDEMRPDEITWDEMSDI